MIILARTGTFQIARPETVFLSFSKSCQKFEAVIGTKLVPSLEMLNTTVWELPLATVPSVLLLSPVHLASLPTLYGPLQESNWR